MRNAGHVRSRGWMTTNDGMRSTALPERISGLGPLSENLWWSWQPQAEDLYRDLDPVLFESLEENPVLLLSAVAPERLRQAAADPDYLARYDEVMERFNALLDGQPRDDLGRRAPARADRATRRLFLRRVRRPPLAAHLLRRSRRARRRPCQSGQRSRAAARRCLAPVPARLSPAAADPRRMATRRHAGAGTRRRADHARARSGW